MKGRVLRVGLTVGFILLVARIFAEELSFFLAPDPRAAFEMRDEIRGKDLELWPPALGRFENHGFVPCPGSYPEAGWCLPPRSRGALIYRLPDVPGSAGLLVRLFFFRRDPQSGNRFAVYRDGESVPRLSFQDVDFIDQRLDLSAALAGPPNGLALHFEGDNRSDGPGVLLQHMEVRLFADPLSTPPSLPRMTLAVLALGLSLSLLVPWRTLTPVVGIFTLGFALRFHALTRVLFLPLPSDAAGFYDHAQRMIPFTDAGFFSASFGYREPMFVLAVKSALWILGNAETHVRLVSFFASLGVILLVYWLAARLFGRLLGCLGALMTAVSLPLVRESTGGLRLEVEQGLLLLFLGGMFVLRWKSRWLRAAFAGSLAGALGLTRVAYAVALVPLVLSLGWCRQRRTYLATVLALVLMMSLQAPHRWNLYWKHGDPLWDVRQNVQLVDPRVAHQRSVEPGAGRQDIVIGELAVGTIRGVWQLVRHTELIGFHRAVARATGLNLAFVDGVFQGVAGVGLVLALLTPGRRWISLAFACLALPIAFVVDAGYSVPVRASGIDRRHFYNVFPLIVLGALLALSRVATGCRDALARHRAARPAAA